MGAGEKLIEVGLATALRVSSPTVREALARHDGHLTFDRAIWVVSENVLLEQLWPVIEAHMTISLAQDQRARPNPERSRRIHAALVESVVARDPGRVEAALHAHTVATAEELIALCHLEPQGHPEPQDPEKETDS